MPKFEKIFLLCLTALLVFSIAISIPWRYQHDAPILFYISFLINRINLVPYKDIFDMNMPGTYLAYSLIGRVFGYSDIGIRIADLMILAVMMVLNWLWMKKISRRAAWFGSVFWGLLYLGFGPTMSLQREYLILIPLLCGVLALSIQSNNKFFRNLAVGFCFGIAFLMKPHAVIGLPFLIVLEFFHERDKQSNEYWIIRKFLKETILPILIGVSIPIIFSWLYLYSHGAINNFVDLVKNYLPLYAQLSGSHRVIFGLSRTMYLIENFRLLGGFAIWLAPASIGSFIALNNLKISSLQNKQIITLLGLTICYSIYPAISGQFWTYHWLLFLFFALQAASICLFSPQEGHQKKAEKIITRGLLLIVVLMTLPLNYYVDFFQGYSNRYAQIDRVDEIVAFLKPQLEDNDTVQPLDWTGGAVHAMLILKARNATPFIYDFHFFHHISNDYVQYLRKTFISDLEKSQPRFIIDMYGDFRPRVKGHDTTREFEELENFIGERYLSVFEGDGYRIYEKRDVSNNQSSQYIHHLDGIWTARSGFSFSLRTSATF